MNRTPQPPSDEMLVAFIDKQLETRERVWVEDAIGADPGVAERFEFLSCSDAPFACAFQPLLDQAPTARLQAMLDGLPAPMPAAAQRERLLSRRNFLGAAACLVAGVAADRVYTGWRHGQDTNWRGLVAEYMALYTPSTLDNLSLDPGAQDAQLQSLGSRLGLPLDRTRINLAGADLRRAQVLEYDGVPIGQITYLDAQYGPLALCITPSQTGTASIDTEQRHGMNVAYWSSQSHALMLIGRNPSPQLVAMAERVAVQLRG